MNDALRVLRYILDLSHWAVQRWRRFRGDAPGVSYWLLRPPSLGDLFVDRKEEIDALKKAVKNHGIVVVYGIAGTGKSRFAVEFSHRRKTKGFWVPFAGSVDSTLATLAPQLGEAPTAASEAELSMFARRRLSQLPKKPLLIIDNIPSVSLLSNLMPIVQSATVLCTTRDDSVHALPPGTGTVAVGVLDPSSAKKMLLSRGRHDPNNPALDELIVAVGALPYALEMLAIRLGDAGESPQSLLRKIRSKSSAVEFEAFRSTEGVSFPHAESIFEAIVGALDDLPQSARAVVGRLAYVSDGPIPRVMARMLNEESDEDFEAALRELRRRGLAQVSGDWLFMHPLTKSAIAATNERSVLRQTLGSMSHVLRFVDETFGLAPPIFLWHGMAVLTRTKVLGLRDRSVAAFANQLGISLRRAGRLAESISLLEFVLEVRAEVDGHEHFDTLASRYNLCMAYSDVGRISETVEGLQVVREKLSTDPAHEREFLHTAMALDHAHYLKGETAEAIKLYEQYLDRVVATFGEGSAEHVTYLGNVALAYRRSGRMEEAVNCQLKATQTLEDKLGPDHLDTLLANMNLASSYRRLGRLDKAGPILDETVARMHRMLGAEHQITLAASDELAACYAEVGDFERALPLHSFAVDGLKRLLGNAHPETVSARMLFAVTSVLAAKEGKGSRLDTESRISDVEKALSALQSDLGPDHPRAVEVRTGLAEARKVLEAPT